MASGDPFGRLAGSRHTIGFATNEASGEIDAKWRDADDRSVARAMVGGRTDRQAKTIVCGRASAKAPAS